jgi:hypothetical protein
MLALFVNVNLFLASGLVFLAALTGFALRGKQLTSLKKKVSELENEMLANHAEILQLQKEKIDILKSITEPSIPVIPINAALDDKMEKMPDGSVRKKLLSSPPIKQQSGK